jgi:hypothetical protein
MVLHRFGLACSNPRSALGARAAKLALNCEQSVIKNTRQAPDDDPVLVVEPS